jgi:hypothetical protein
VSNGRSNKNLNERISAYLTDGYGHCLNEFNCIIYFLIFSFFPFSPCAVRLFPIKSAPISRRKLAKNSLGKGEQGENGN